MKKLLFLFISIIIFSNCEKDQFNPPPQNFPSSQNFLASQDVPSIQNVDATAALAIECPELQDINCPANLDLDDLFGYNYGSFEEQSSQGHLDRVMNCPYSAYVFCERPCESVVVSFNGNPGFDFIERWTGDEPCVNGIYSVEAQQKLIDKVLQLAIDHAPICPVTNTAMNPVAYNLFWVGFLGVPPSISIGVHIAYTTPCGAIE